MSLKQVTLKEVSEHNSMKSLWFVIGNKVYDVTKFVDEVLSPTSFILLFALCHLINLNAAVHIFSIYYFFLASFSD